MSVSAKELLPRRACCMCYPGSGDSPVRLTPHPREPHPSPPEAHSPPPSGSLAAVRSARVTPTAEHRRAADRPLLNNPTLSSVPTVWPKRPQEGSSALRLWKSKQEPHVSGCHSLGPPSEREPRWASSSTVIIPKLCTSFSIVRGLNSFLQPMQAFCLTFTAAGFVDHHLGGYFQHLLLDSRLALSYGQTEATWMAGPESLRLDFESGP